MSSSEREEQVDRTMRSLGYNRVTATKDHRTVERYEAPETQLQNVSKDLASLIDTYVENREREAEKALLKKLKNAKTRNEGNPWDEFAGHCTTCKMILESLDDECACDFITEKPLAALQPTKQKGVE